MKKLIAITSTIILVAATYGVSFSEAFRKYPYLQNVKPSEITICWKIENTGDTTDQENYRIEYGIEEDITIVPYPSPHPDDSRLFQLTLTGLQPATCYSYKVRSGTEWSNDSTFCTAVEGNQPFSFTAYADTQDRGDQPGNENHQAVVTLVNSFSPDFIIHAGDVFDRSSPPKHVINETFSRLFQIARKKPVFLVPCAFSMP